MDTNASQAAARQIMSPTERANVVVVDAPVKRTQTRSGIHKGSRAAVIRRARKENPQFANAAAVEVFYGTDQSTDTAIRFDPTKPVEWGF